MADLRCPNCGKNNPDSLDRCQFCQSSLKPESMLHAGESPTKKQTGELEPVLPDWLKDLRQQGRQSAEEDAAQKAAEPKDQRNEPADLLAGLASQTGAHEDEIPDWLASLSSQTKARSSESPSTAPAFSTAQEDQASQPEKGEERDELSEWFSQASEQPSEPFILEPGISQDDPDWISNLSSAARSSGEVAPPPEEEDLGWLHSLEASAKQPDKPVSPSQDSGWMPPSQVSPGEEDLSWLNHLGGISKPTQPAEEIQDESPATEPFAPQEDLSWLDNLGQTEPLKTAQPPAAQGDLSWLDNLGDIPEVPATEPVKPAPQEDLDWLKTPENTAEATQAQSPQPSSSEDLAWRKDIEKTSDVPDPSSSVFSPRRTAPLGDESESEAMPDWLKHAAEEPSMPPLGSGALGWFASHDLDEGQPAATTDSSIKEPALSEEASPFPLDQSEGGPSSTRASESQLTSNQDIDALFSIDVPDWLSSPEAGKNEVSLQEAKVPSPERDESLAPVELPSWVQAMKPVEAVISETAASSEAQAVEAEGPLAGLRGVIPLLPIGSSRRPKALSLTLQTTDEQRAGATLLEEILADETAPRTFVGASTVTSQNVLRWVLAGIVFVVLGAMIALGSRSMPISDALPVQVSAASMAVANLPDGAPVLVIVDYEPALAAEMEAISSPLLNNLVLSHRPTLSFLSTSLNGPALIQRLMTNTKLAGEQYLNLGYLPGGSAGVLAFIESPPTVSASASVENISEYATVIVLTDHAESGRVWVEQLDARKQSDSALASQPLLMIASAQTGPLLQPYVESRQVTGFISGLPDAARYEFANGLPPGNARTYWDAFGIGLLLAIILITFGSLWNLIVRIRPRGSGSERG